MAKSPSARGSRGDIGGISYRTIAAAIVVALSLWFVLANTESATIRFWIPTVEAPMWTVLVGAFLAGGLTGWWVKGSRV